jgi:hypothetical protein
VGDPTLITLRPFHVLKIIFIEVIWEIAGVWFKEAVLGSRVPASRNNNDLLIYLHLHPASVFSVAPLVVLVNVGTERIVISSERLALLNCFST